jgi:hypothetical protein
MHALTIRDLNFVRRVRQARFDIPSLPKNQADAGISPAFR